MTANWSERVRVLSELTRQLQASPSFADLLSMITGRAAELLGVERVSIRLLDPSGTRLLAVCRAGRPLHLNPSEEFKVGEGLSGWIVQNTEPIRTGDAENDDRYVDRPMHEPLRSFLGVPLVAGDAILGVLSAASSQKDEFDEHHHNLLTLLAGIAAPHIEIARRDFVVRDPLTGLFNHARFHEMLEREIDRCMSYGLPFSLVIIDVDHFRSVNNTESHQVGDSLLKVMAEVVVGRHCRDGRPFRLRGQDSAARYGGDEFALLLPHTPKNGAEIKGEQLRAFVEGFDFSPWHLGRQTVSVGVASVPDDAQDRVGLITAAEHAVRAAKRCGRNTTVGYSRALAVADALETSMAVDIDRFIALEETIEQQQFHFVYQPIVDSENNRVIAYEGLCRPENSSFPGPAALFETAEHAGRVQDLGRACRLVSTAPLRDLPVGCLLFLNLHPSELSRDLLKEPGLEGHAHKIVLEITETAEIDDYDSVRTVIAELRHHGFRIALDDLGAGYAGLNALAQLQPDFVKLDMALIRRIHTKSSTRRLVKHILEFCSGEDIPVISEGVETAEEHDMVREIGCPLMQGDFLGSPAPPFAELSAPITRNQST